MNKGRMEAFSDGVIAIIITIMMFLLRAPHGDGVQELEPLLPVFLSYVLSFVYVGIYWNNHHHMLHACSAATGAMLWANVHLLIPTLIVSARHRVDGENHFAAAPTALYGVVLMAPIASYPLEQTILRAQVLRKAVGRDWKCKGLLVLYLAAIGVALRSTSMRGVVLLNRIARWPILRVFPNRQKLLCRPQRVALGEQGLANERNRALGQRAAKSTEHRTEVIGLGVGMEALGSPYCGSDVPHFSTKVRLHAEECGIPDAKIGKLPTSIEPT